MTRAERIEEVSVWIDVNGRRLCRTTASPDRLDALAIGRLASAGFIASAAEVLGLERENAPAGCHGVRAQIDADADRRARVWLDHLDSHGCGPLGSVTCHPPPPRRGDAAPAPAAAAVPQLLRALTAAEQEERGEHGGMHGCAVVVEGVIRIAVFDVGRHSALDKAIGSALLEGLPAHSVGLVTTARISGEMAAKAAWAGVAWLAGRSLATTLALDVAGAARLPIITGAGSSSPRLHAPPEHDARTPP